MQLKDRIKEAMTHANLSAAALSRATGKTGGAVTQWLDGTTKSIKGETAAKMQTATGYSASWLATGEGPKHPQTLPAVYQPNMPLALAGRAVAATETIAELVTKLGAALGATDPITRAQTAPILEQLSKTPELAAELGARLEATIKMGTQAPFAPVNPFPKK